MQKILEKNLEAFLKHRIEERMSAEIIWRGL